MTTLPLRLPASAAASTASTPEPLITADPEAGGRWAWPLVAGLTSICVMVVALTPSSLAGRWTTVSLGVVASLAMAVAAGPAARAQTPQTARRRLGWLFISWGAMPLVAAEAARAVPSVRPPAYPQLFDWPGVLGYPLIIFGLLLLTWMHVQERPLDSLMVAGMVPAAVGFLIWAIVTDGVTVRTSSLAGHTLAALTFVLFDALLVALSVRLVLLTRGEAGSNWYLALGFGCLLAAHVSRAFATATGDEGVRVVVRPMLALGLGLVACAAVHPAATRRVHRSPTPAAPGVSRVWLLGVVVVLAPAVDVWHLMRGGRPAMPLIVASAAFSAVVVAHLGRTVHDLVEAQRVRRYDELTELAGRTLFRDLLRQRLTGLRRDGSRVAVLVLDIDRFKKVNDSLGQAAGDELLAAVAQRLKATLLRPLTMARLGGDEFALMLPGADRRVATALAQEVLGAFADQFVVAGHQVVVTASVGTAVAPEHGTDAEVLLQRADTAMYAAKAAHGNTFRIYENAMHERASERLELESNLHSALDRGQIVVHYQPKVDVRTGGIVGAEALMRWEHPTWGTVPPLEFIGLAEETGLIAPLGEWMLREVCRQQQAWRAAGVPVVPVAVNVSARQFELQDVAELVAHALDDSGLPPTLLELELTESLAVTGAESVIAVLGDLKLIGVRCSIDDFGTGYSALTYLSRFPVQQLKVDKSFVAGLSRPDGDAEAIVRAVVAMGRGLGLEVIAEGVETEGQLDFLRNLGCDVMQGHLFSQALPPERYAALLGATSRTVPLRRRPRAGRSIAAPRFSDAAQPTPGSISS